jgi:hypothetical protein
VDDFVEMIIMAVLGDETLHDLRWEPFLGKIPLPGAVIS